MRVVFFLMIFSLCATAKPAFASLELAQQRNCTACHAIDKPLLGPPFQSVAEKYRGQADAPARLAEKLIKGGAGVWGNVPMPPNALSGAEAQKLVDWVLSQTSSAVIPAPAARNSGEPGRFALAPKPVTTQIRTQTQDEAIRRGKYLVDNVMGCGNCHAGRADDTSILPGKELSGGRTYDTPAFVATPGNLTSDHETGIGNWSDADFTRALTEGKRPNGLPLAPMMPVTFYRALIPEDIQAIAAYLRSVPPVKNAPPPPVYKQSSQFDVYPDAEIEYSAPAMAADKLLRGRYLAALAHCLDCHTPIVNGISDYARDGGKGGRRMGVARVPVPNITSHPVKGIGGWTDQDIKRAIMQGKTRDGRTLRYPMAWPYLAGLTADDLDSLVVWLRTLPARE